MMRSYFTAAALFAASGSVYAATGVLSSDSPCTLASGSTTCTTNFQATGVGTAVICAWKVQPTPIKLRSCGGSAYVLGFTWPWTGISPTTIELRGHTGFPDGSLSSYSGSQFLDRETVNAVLPPQPSGNLSANSPCQLGPTESNCTVQLTAEKSNVPIACIWKEQTRALISCNANSNWSTSWAWAGAIGSDLVLKAHSIYPTQDSNWPNSRESIFLAAQTLDREVVFGLLSSPRPKNIAHRGNSDNYVENGQLALISAAQVGADFVEIDASVTLDGVPMIYHDSTFGRLVQCDRVGLTNRAVSELRWSDISSHCKYQAALVGNPSSVPLSCQFYPADRILRLTEALRIADCAGLGVLLEIKPNAAAAAFRDLADYSAQQLSSRPCSEIFSCFDRVLVQSFQTQSLDAFDTLRDGSESKYLQNIRLVRLIGSSYGQYLLSSDSYWSYLWDRDGVAFDYRPFGEDLLLSVNLMRLQHPSKWIGIYTPNAAGVLQTVNRGSLDGIVTDAPATLYQIQY